MNLINWVLKLLKWVIIILLIYLLLPLLFSIFPFTRGWASTLFGLVWSPFKKMVIAVWRYLPKLFTIIVICFVFKYLIRFVKYFFKEIESERLKIGNFHSDWAIPTFNIVRVLLYVFMFVLIFPNLPGSESPIFRGVSVFLGLLVSLGSSTAIGNIVAGFVITYMRPFKIGDRIKFGDVTGDVMEKNLLVTRLRTIYNEEITIPNSSILSGNTTNFSAMAKTEGLVLSVTVSVDYKYHWQDIHEALLEAASRTSKVLKDKKPGVLQTALNDFYVSYTLCVYTHETNSFNPIYSELYQHILDVCKERDIEIVSPHLFTLKQDEPPKGKK
jgi:small-conductance mechanosensitive channel